MTSLGMYNIVVKSVVFNKNKVLLLKRTDYQKMSAFEWDLPGGRLEPGEDPNIAIHRETLEETGIKINLLYPFDCHYFFSKDENVDKVSIAFLSEYSSGELKKSHEHELVDWFDIQNLPENLTVWVKNLVKKAINLKK